jgi:hypothetical protein
VRRIPKEPKSVVEKVNVPLVLVDLVIVRAGGIWSVKVIAMGCMSAQMDYEIVKKGQGHPAPSAPPQEKMERGVDDQGQTEQGTLDNDEDADAWWKKP